MFEIRHVFIGLGMLLCSVASADQVSIDIGLPNASIGFNLPVYPELVVVQGYPVYYAPQLEANFFFYDGMYWVYQNDNWYASSWDNGPWWLIGPEDVPVFVLRIPVRYYRQPPAYFRGWWSDAPPRWGDHWGRDWEQRRGGWDRWNHGAVPALAPLPAYQQQYSGDRYPQQARQQQLLKQNYRFQPRDPVVRLHNQGQAVQKAPTQQAKPQQVKPQPQKQGAPTEKSSKKQDSPAAPHSQPNQKGGENVQRSTPASPQQRRTEVQDHKQPPQPELGQNKLQMPRSQGQEEKQQGNDATREPKQGQEQKQNREKKQEQKQEQEGGRDRNE